MIMKLFYSFLFLVSFFALTSQEKTDKLARELKEKQEFKLREHEPKTCGFKGQLIFDKDSLIGFDEELEWQKSILMGYNISDKTVAIARAKRNFIDFKYGYKTPYTGGINQVQSGCNNVDFETGNTSGWTAIEGDNINSSTYQMGPTINTTQAVICAPGFVDPNAIPITGTSPLGGNCLRLGKTSLGGTAYKLSQTFTVTPANSVFIYAYAVVLENGSHTCSEQPYFTIRFKDCSGNLIPCSDYDVIPYSTSCTNGDNSFSTAANGYRYKNWTTKSFDLTSYIGQCVTIDFQVAGCVIAQGAHTGYCYVDCSCKPMTLTLNGIDIPVGQVNNSLCQTSTNTLCAPLGFDAYSWTGPGVTGQTGQCITPAAAGNYSVTLTMTGVSCSSPVLYSSFNYTPSQISSFTNNALPCQNSLSVPFTSSVNLNGGPPVTYSWDFNNDGVVDDNTANPTFTYPAYGTYTAQLQVSNGACLNTLSQVVSILPTPTVSASSIAPVCPATCSQLVGSAGVTPITSTNSVSFTNTTSIAIPDGSGNATSTINTSGLSSATLTSVCFNINHTWDGDLTITLICPSGTQLVLSNGNGGSGDNYSNTCFNLTSAQVITSGSAPFTGSFTPQGGPLSNLNGCTLNGAWKLKVADNSLFDSGTLTNWTLNFLQTNVYNPTVTYTWSPNTSMTGGSSLTPTVCPTVPTIYTLSATNAANGCVATSTVQVQPAVGAPTLAVTSNSIALNCNTPVQTVTVSGTPSSNLTYSWNATPASLSVGNSVATFTNAGNYICTVTNTVTNCVSTISVAVTNNTTVPTTTASTSGILTCNNFTVGLNSTLSGMNYTWTAPSGGSVTSSSTQTTVANGVGNYTLAVINPSNGCTYTTTTTVTQNTATPVLSAGPSQTLTCASPSVALNGTVSTPANPTVNWTGPSVCGAATNVTTQVCSAGIYTLTATDPLNGCVNTSTVEVYPNLGAPTATISSNSLVLNCITLSQTATVTSTPNTDVTYSWNTAPASLTANGTIATFTSNGTYVCTVTNTITNCSITTQVVVTTNNTPPTINITPTQTISCANPTAIITLTTIPTSGLTYTWGPTPVSGQGTNSVLVNQANIYTVTVTDAANGCTNTATSEIISDANVPSASINVTSSNTIITCSNPSVTLTASVTPNATYSYTWIPSGSSSSINVTSATVYTVIALNSITGCTTFATYNVLSNTTPPNLVANNAIIPCNSTSVNVAATSTNNAVSYNWSTTNGNLLTNGTGTVAVGSTGSYVVTATDLDNGCTNTATATVSQSTISAGFIANPVYGTAPLVVDFTNQSSGASSYTWTFGDGNTSTSINPANTYTMIGVYIVTLTAVDASGSCVSTSTISIEVIDNSLIEVPNVFTPNGDGSNEVFKIKTKAIKELTCEIYNRWGLKLYTITSPSDYWDGSGYSAGTYYYILNAKGYDGKEYKDHGFLSLFK